MRVFLGHMTNNRREIPDGVSIAASHFSCNLLRGGMFDKAYSILPPMIGYAEARGAANDEFEVLASRWRRLPGLFRALGALAEQCTLFRRLPRGSELWLYNVTNLNLLLIKLLRAFKPSVAIYPIVLDFTPGQPDERRVMRAYNDAAGRVSLTTYERIAKHNFRCLPGVVPPPLTDGDKPGKWHVDAPRPVFLLSGALGENISMVSKVIEAMGRVPGAELHISGVGGDTAKIAAMADKYANVTFHGKVTAAEYERLLAGATFLLSTRDPGYLENRCNFPSKIIEALLRGRAVVSTIHYPQIEGMRYFEIPADAEGMEGALRRIAAMAPADVMPYCNQGEETRRRFSTDVWRLSIEDVERPYDYVYLTNTPSFYKLELCRRLAARGMKILLVLIGYGAEAVNSELRDEERARWGFDWVFLHQGRYVDRGRLATFRRLRRLMRSIRYRKILYSGWYMPEYILYSFLSPRRDNVLICESSEFEVATSGIKGWVKRRIVSRMGSGLPSGISHERLLKRLGLRGPQWITGSVGIFRKNGVEYHSAPPVKRFLYVGRLTEVKNLKVLAECFNRNGLPLTIVGGGELEAELKHMAAPNITFTGFIDNEKLSSVYENHDVFILPSRSEPWGLVVEEALYRGLPCVVSDKVGSGPDMVLATGAGVTFRHDSPDDLRRAVDEVSRDYERYAAAARSIDFAARDLAQLEAYHKALDY